MCSPGAAIASLFATKAAIDIANQNKIAVMQAKAANEYAKANINSLNEQAAQSQEAAALDKFNRMREALAERARLNLSAAEGGVSGNTVGKELFTADMLSMLDTSIIDKNLTNTLSQIENEKISTLVQAQNQRNLAKANSSNWFSSLFSIGTGGLQGYTIGNKLK